MAASATRRRADLNRAFMALDLSGEIATRAACGSGIMSNIRQPRDASRVRSGRGLRRRHVLRGWAGMSSRRGPGVRPTRHVSGVDLQDAAELVVEVPAHRLAEL